MPGVDHRRRSRSNSPTSQSNSDNRRRYKESRYERHDDNDSRRRSSSRSSDHHRAKHRKVGRSVTPPPTHEERDRKTVFVQQLAARLRTRELWDFFERAGPVYDASIVKDKATKRSKGVAYVEFLHQASVSKAINMTGEKLLGIPVIVQYTESEKNRQAQLAAAGGTDGGGNQPKESAVTANSELPTTAGNASSAGPASHRIYVGNVYFGITENELHDVFKSFGEIEYVHIQKDFAGKSKGYAFIQFQEKSSADQAIEKMNGFMLAHRSLRVGRGGGHYVDNSKTNNKDSTLDDSDIGGVSYNKVSRTHLMEKLMRDSGGGNDNKNNEDTQQQQQPQTTSKPPPSRCILLNNMFDVTQESGDNWIQELEDDVKAECEDKYGPVIHISVDPNSQGQIYVKFKDLPSGQKAVEGLNGRFFGGRKITVNPIVEMVYTLK